QRCQLRNRRPLRHPRQAAAWRQPVAVPVLMAGRQRIGRYLLALLLVAGVAPAAVAQTGVTQNLLQVWQKALQRDPIYAASQSARQAEQEAVPQARSRLLPQVSADALALTNDA